MSDIISFFQKLIKGGWNKSGGLDNFSKINKRGGDDYLVLESSAGVTHKDLSYYRLERQDSCRAYVNSLGNVRTKRPPSPLK